MGQRVQAERNRTTSASKFALLDSKPWTTVPQDKAIGATKQKDTEFQSEMGDAAFSVSCTRSAGDCVVVDAVPQSSVVLKYPHRIAKKEGFLFHISKLKRKRRTFITRKEQVVRRKENKTHGSSRIILAMATRVILSQRTTQLQDLRNESLCPVP